MEKILNGIIYWGEVHKIEEKVNCGKCSLGGLCRGRTAGIGLCAYFSDNSGYVKIGDIEKYLGDNENPFLAILKQMYDLYQKKNTDYGNSFDKQLDEDGLLVSKIRLSDKLNRFSNLIKNSAEVQDEKIEDTLIDLANYTVMTLTWLERKKNDN